MELPGKRKRGRPKRRFMDVVKEDMAEVEVTEEDTVDRRNWRKKIRCGDPWWEKPKEEEEELVEQMERIVRGFAKLIFFQKSFFFGIELNPPTHPLSNFFKPIRDTARTLTSWSDRIHHITLKQSLHWTLYNNHHVQEQ